MSQGVQTTYAELAAVLDILPTLVRETRRARKLSLRAAARDIGMPFSTVMRVESGDDCVLSSAATILRWLDARPPATTADNP